jgi:branched-chain amino acid transport system ATP-binding protein
MICHHAEEDSLEAAPDASSLLSLSTPRLSTGEPLLKVMSVTRRFGGLVAVNDVSLCVYPREIVGIIGPNGAGKTTLFSLLSGFNAVNSGDILFAGESIMGMPPHRIAARGLARTFQVVRIFPDMTVLESVTTAALLRHPMRKAIRRAEDALEQVGLGAKAHSLPTTLSIQDKKLLEIAKCCATQPQLILLDEVMAGMTLVEAEVPLGVIRRLRDDGMTFVMVEHVMPLIMSVADRIVVLNFGQKIAEGTPAQVVAEQAVIDAYLGDEVDA